MTEAQCVIPTQNIMNVGVEIGVVRPDHAGDALRAPPRLAGADLPGFPELTVRVVPRNICTSLASRK